MSPNWQNLIFYLDLRTYLAVGLDHFVFRHRWMRLCNKTSYLLYDRVKEVLAERPTEVASPFTDSDFYDPYATGANWQG